MAPGGTTADGMFTLEDAECLALCGNAPCLTVNWRFFGDVDPDALRPARRRPAGRPPRRRGAAPRHAQPGRPDRRPAGAARRPGRRRRPHAGQSGAGRRPAAPGRRRRPSISTPTRTTAGGGIARRRVTSEGAVVTITDAPRIVTRRLGQAPLVDPRVLPGRRRLRRACAAALAMTPEQIHEHVNTANILGRGGAGFEAGRKWGMLRKAEPVYLTINGDESEPATFKDHALIEGDPHQLIEGALICAYAIGADQVFIFVRGEFPLGHRAAAGRPQRGLRLRGGRAATSSAAASPSTSSSTPAPAPTSAARRRPCSRAWRASGAIPASSRRSSRPPSASTARPTIVNNVETVSNLPWVMLNGGDAFAALGEGRSKGTKLLALAGHVKRPGNYELEWAKASFRDLIYDPRLGGGIRDDNELKAFIPGGASSPWLGPEHLDVPAGQRGHRRGRHHGRVGLGHPHGPHHLHGPGRLADRPLLPPGVLRAVHARAGRAAAGWRRSCERIENGQGRESDLDLLMDVCDNISPGVTWPPGPDDHLRARARRCRRRWPPGMRMFRDEFLAHIREGRCPFPPDRLPRRLARV